MPNLLDLDAVGVEQSDDSRQGEARFAEAVGFGVDGVVEGRAEIRFFEVRVVKEGFQEVAPGKRGSHEVGFGEVRLLKVAVFEHGLFQAEPEKGREFHHAAFEAQFEKKGPALAELHAEQLALPEEHLLQAQVFHLRQTEIAPFEGAVPEGHARKLRAGEAAAEKTALLVHAAEQVFCIENGFFENHVLGKLDVRFVPLVHACNLPSGNLF